ncbi:metalloregulator ArsR/SmtB family transcription factor [Paenibacillus larvae]|uniref:Metalloregulator ArsR/SmtB family transcription factor n=1 Tax=Paenibacillus larvae TaxID=1464 RepID=A0AAP5JRL4_9BACL|nr:metalloregulator ArsR/SmtB family transcription factor [Paenibacillus larvae]AQR79355.1 transcriptional regulator [Paenibacillus larvae subsp. larvae]MCY7492060.1 metalloregulator ArsR/SmtB family transcription factor [Paenibacillus larvae]MCY9565832.1 metalloregulator ArsR/SmtB family transcription factor [Paenibacillus larvae]MCY9570017.1 metalloregulator ArsR/SmtB family transcription factor [Paenibacillus larvae]MCY9573830.1 metalloregulator ArsR/SmtB family transcription factor [Paenib
MFLKCFQVTLRSVSATLVLGLSIIACLVNQELCVCDVVALLGLSQPAISQHLKKLKKADIITERKVGTWVHVRLNTELEPYVREIINALPSKSEVVKSYLKIKNTTCL